MPRMMQLNAIDLLKDDHRRLEDLISRFDSADDDHRKRELAKEAIEELQTHTLIEEEILYPTCREALGSDELVNEAQEAHHVAKIVMTELRLMPAGDRFNAKFRNLCKAVHAHIQEEESDLFPRLQGSTLDLERMGRDMRDLRSHRAARALAMAASPSGLIAIGAILAAIAAGLWFSTRSEKETPSQRLRKLMPSMKG